MRLKPRADKLYKFSRFYRTFEVPIDPADPTQAAFYAMGKMS